MVPPLPMNHACMVDNMFVSEISFSIVILLKTVFVKSILLFGRNIKILF